VSARFTSQTCAPCGVVDAGSCESRARFTVNARRPRPSGRGCRAPAAVAAIQTSPAFPSGSRVAMCSASRHTGSNSGQTARRSGRCAVAQGGTQPGPAAVAEGSGARRPQLLRGPRGHPALQEEGAGRRLPPPAERQARPAERARLPPKLGCPGRGHRRTPRAVPHEWNPATIQPGSTTSLAGAMTSKRSIAGATMSCRASSVRTAVPAWPTLTVALSATSHR
jgi:hypothetical protein